MPDSTTREIVTRFGFQEHLQVAGMALVNAGAHFPGGMLMLPNGRLWRTGDSVDREGWRFEIVDMDGKKIDKVLALRVAAPVAVAPVKLPSIIRMN